MKMKKQIVVACMGMLGMMLSGCSSNSDADDPNSIPPLPQLELSTSESAINEGLNTFGFELLNAVDKNCEKICATSYDGNVTVSPLSASLALALLANAGDDSLTDATAKLLHCSDLAELNTLSNKLLRHLTADKTIELANAVWYNRTLMSPNQSFVKDMESIFYADVNPADFGTEKATDLINAWCAAKTHGKISKVLQQTNVDDIFYLINALYFNDEWEVKFDKSDTKPGTFAGKPIEAMMHNRYSGAYFANDRYECAELPFKSNTSMYVLLPKADEATAAQSLARDLTYAQWKTDMESAGKRLINLQLPRFEINQGGNIDVALFDMGLPAGSVALDKMGTVQSDSKSKLHVIQKTSTTVNEKGAEVAAVTIVGGDLMALPEEPLEAVNVTVDRPFVFLIINNKTGSMLMAGRINTIK